MKLIDVTVPLDADLPVYPGNTPFVLEPIKRIARGDSSNVSTLHMSAHAGTHVDAPRHFFDAGRAPTRYSSNCCWGGPVSSKYARAQASAQMSSPLTICQRMSGS